MTEMASLIDEYVTARRRKGELTKDAAAGYRSVLRAFADTYGGREVKKLRPRHVEKFLETRGALAASTRRSQFSRLRQFFQWLVREGHVAKNPILVGEILPPKQPRRKPRALHHDPVADLFMAAPDRRGRAILALMAGCGLRCCEVSRLKLEDWDRRENTIRVTGKGGHERFLPVPVMVVDYLNSYLVEFPATTGPLIRSYKTVWGPLAAATISKLVGKWMRESGVKLAPRDGVSAHALRHTAATDVLERSGDLQAVQVMLGHESLATTEIYLAHASVKRLRPAMEGRDYRRGAGPPAAEAPTGRVLVVMEEEVRPRRGLSLVPPLQ